MLGVEIPDTKTRMGVEKGETRAGISAQTSVGDKAATTGGHGEATSRVASGQTSTVTGAGYSGRSATAKHTQSALHRGVALVHEDSDHESVGSVNSVEEEALLRSPARSKGAVSDSKNRPRIKPDKEKLKAKARYRAAVKVCDQFGSKTNLTKQEEERLAWAKEEVKNGRAFYATKPQFASSDPKYANRIEEEIVLKRQRSADSEASGPSKKQKHKDERAKPKDRDNGKPTTSRAAAAVSEIAKKHLIVALIDRSDKLGQMSQERWKVVEMKLLETLFAKMDAEPKASMPAFDGAGWFSGVKIIKCKDDPTLTWIKEVVKTLQGLWEGASLEIVDRSCIPSIPKAKVLIPRVVKPEDALRLLQRQNPDVPTSDWRVLNVAKPATADGGQNYILQINKTAEDLLYARFGRMAWGVGSVYLRLKKRNPKDDNHNTLETGEVEKDLGIDEILEASLNLRDVEKGELEEVSNPVKVPDLNVEGPSNKSPQK